MCVWWPGKILHMVKFFTFLTTYLNQVSVMNLSQKFDNFNVKSKKDFFKIFYIYDLIYNITAKNYVKKMTVTCLRRLSHNEKKFIYMDQWSYKLLWTKYRNYNILKHQYKPSVSFVYARCSRKWIQHHSAVMNKSKITNLIGSAAFQERLY